MAFAMGDQRFAEDLDRNAPAERYSAIFRMTPRAGVTEANCAFVGVHLIYPVDPVQVELSPSSLFIADACRKLTGANWFAGENRQRTETFYFCLLDMSSPDYAFCERKFGE